MRCAVIARHRDEFPVRLMCRVLEVSVAGFYAYRQRPESWRAMIDDVLMAHVRIAFSDSGETYGAPRVHQELRAAGLAARPRTRRRVVTTDSTHGDPIAPNRVARQFDVHGIALNQVWVGDITYIPTRDARPRG